MKRLFPILFLAACGGDYCARSAKYAEDCGETVSDDSKAACEDALSSCTNDDQKKLNDVLDCYDENGLLSCESTDTVTSSGTEQLSALFACIAPAMSVSAECASGMEMGFGTTSTTTTGSTN